MMIMNMYVGTSGYSYKEWKGSFYPEKITEKQMLNFYSERFNTVEINNTFYRMPKAEVFESWLKQVPSNFKFSIKAPKSITHSKKLESNDSINYLLKMTSVLGSQLGVILFQYPPYCKKDIERLKPFTECIPENVKVAFEFRHESWFDDDIFVFLTKNNYALCLSDTDEKPIHDLVPTSDFVYLRLRKFEYDMESLSEINNKVKNLNPENAFIFFKHEDEGKGPAFAKLFLEINKAIKTKV